MNVVLTIPSTAKIEVEGTHNQPSDRESERRDIVIYERSQKHEADYDENRQESQIATPSP
jgi:hypothetical protein